MSFSIGIVGLPNVGKSTLFQALTRKQVNTSNYPFCTIDPNVGVVAVPDGRLDKLTGVLKPEKVLPTTIEFVDIAGLVKNAHKGEGLGNQFLSHIREASAICHVVRVFEDENISHVAGKLDPESDTETINLELIFAGLATVDQRLEEVRPKAKTGIKEAKEQLPVLEKIKETLEAGKLVNTTPFSQEEEILVKELNLLTSKPIFLVYNVSEQDIQKYDNKLAISARLEAELSELSKKEAQEYLEEFGLKEPGLSRVIKKAYQVLELITFFTTQNNILQAWTVPQNTKAPQAAGRIHTDFEKCFIKAEVINWKDLVGCFSEINAREQGKVRLEGKDYLVQDGDVIHFKTG